MCCPFWMRISLLHCSCEASLSEWGETNYAVPLPFYVGYLWINGQSLASSTNLQLKWCHLWSFCCFYGTYRPSQAQLEDNQSLTLVLSTNTDLCCFQLMLCKPKIWPGNSHVWDSSQLTTCKYELLSLPNSFHDLWKWQLPFHESCRTHQVSYQVGWHDVCWTHH